MGLTAHICQLYSYWMETFKAIIYTKYIQQFNWTDLRENKEMLN